MFQVAAESGDVQVMLPFAHTGHWIADLMVLAPVLGVAIWLAVAGIRDRRRS
jgi:hypothetical protein